MAEFLIAKVDIPPKYRAGMPISCEPDGTDWGRKVIGNPKFEIIEMPLVSVERGRQMLVPYLEPDPTSEAPDVPDRVIQRAYRDCRFDRDALPRSKRNRLDRDQRITQDGDVTDAWRRLAWNDTRGDFDEDDREFSTPRIARTNGGRGGSS